MSHEPDEVINISDYLMLSQAANKFRTDKYVNITVNFSIAFAHFPLVHKTTKYMKKQRL